MRADGLSPGRQWGWALLLGGSLVAASPVIPAGPAAAAEFHGLSTFGELKYPAGFKHFDYVNPLAPKGGRLSMIGTASRATFDSFNGYILRGDAAQGLAFLFDTLLTPAGDEPDALYGLVARSADVAADKLSVTFRLRPEAKFADGSPLRAGDVKFSFDTLKKDGHPSYRISLRDVVSAEAPDPLTVRYKFQGQQVRDLPLIVATLPIFSKAFYSTRKFDKTTLEPPLGSGPYRIKDYKQGTQVTFERRDDYWARDLPVNKGRFNFDELRYEYFRDRTASLENLKNGTYDLREEFTSKDWATAYNVPAVKEGRLLRLTLPDERPGGAQGFFFNMRRPQFADQRVRQALDLAFNFEWTNKNVFYSLYKRTHSIFENSNMKASGNPAPGELALLEPFRDKLPPAVFGEPYVSPTFSEPGARRKNLRKAIALMKDAGWFMRDIKLDDPSCGMICKIMMTVGLKQGKTEQRLRSAKGEPLKVEFLIYEPSFERVINPYIRNLRAIGIEASIRRVDSAQYERRVKSYDFDVVTQRFVLGLTPGISLKNYLSSEVADVDGSFNLAGIKNPVVDALILKITEASSRADLIDATRALDRVLRAGNYWVPHWYKAAHNIAFWNKFSRPKVKPRYARGVIDTWWYDAAKAAKLKAQ